MALSNPDNSLSLRTSRKDSPPRLPHRHQNSLLVDNSVKLKSFGRIEFFPSLFLALDERVNKHDRTTNR